MRRTAENAARTRVALLHAALKTFAEQGWRGTTFEHVAEGAGVTRGALHHHFRSKEVLLEEALSWGWAEYGDHLFGSDDATLSELLSEFVRLLHEDDQFRALTACTVLVAPQVLSDTSDKDAALEAWRTRIAAAVHGKDRSAAESVGDIVLVLLQGLTVTAVMRPKDLPQPDELSAIIQALAQGLTPT